MPDNHRLSRRSVKRDSCPQHRGRQGEKQSAAVAHVQSANQFQPNQFDSLSTDTFATVSRTRKA